MNPHIAQLRSHVYRLTREFFYQKGYLEVETPLLSPALIPESSIEVFETNFHYPSQDPIPLYLIPSPEVWMKRLIQSGWPSIFQISKSFRNFESIGKWHNPEFTLLEYYTQGADYLNSIDITEEYLTYLISNIPKEYKTPRLASLLPPFRRMRMEEAFKEFAGFDLASLSREDLIEKAKQSGFMVSENNTWESVFNLFFVHQVEPNLPKDRPLVLLDYPEQLYCLAKRIPHTPWRERWELYLEGIELANCFTEESDPREIETYFSLEGDLKASSKIPHVLDEEFRKMYQKGFPLCSGVALGMDRLLMKLAGASSIQGVILFPLSDIIKNKIHTKRRERKNEKPI
ncbi:MAG: amino acid--tRNA ligase-related protein [Spirochaetales bacterium]